MKTLNRRTFLGAAAMSASVPVLNMSAQSTPVVADPVDELIIDLPAEPLNIHPARAYKDIEWSIVHSVFDALIGFDAEGTLRPIAAERFELVDDTTWEVALRPDMTFHDGSAVTSAAILRGFDLVSGSDSLVSDIFSIVDSVEEVDELTARIMVAVPAPWLPAQMASWHVLVPESFDAEQPVGSGPFVFDAWSKGELISLQRFENYVPAAAKGTAIADAVTFHFVPDVTTRNSNLLSGASDISTFMPIDSLSAITGDGLELKHTKVAGSWFIRIATDVAPFDNELVRRALNSALNLDAFVGALVHDGSERLATIYPGPVAMGFDPELEVYEYNQEVARGWLEEAGFGDGIDVRLELTSDSSLSVAEAIAAQWAEIGVNAEIVVSDLGTFNATWTDSEAPALRMASWSPLFDPSTLLDLVFRSDGVLSRYGSDEVDSLIEQAGTQTDEAAREQDYAALGEVLNSEAAAVFLWNLVNVAGGNIKGSSWTPRPDQWVLPLAR